MRKHETPRLCDMEGCGRPHKGGGLCETHRYRKAHGLPMDPPINQYGNSKKPKPIEERTSSLKSSGAVTLSYSLPPATAQQLFDVAGTGYGAVAKVVRQAITQYLENRDTSFWRGKYMAERTARMALQQKIDEAKRALG